MKESQSRADFWFLSPYILSDGWAVFDMKEVSEEQYFSLGNLWPSSWIVCLLIVV